MGIFDTLREAGVAVYEGVKDAVSKGADALRRYQEEEAFRQEQARLKEEEEARKKAGQDFIKKEIRSASDFEADYKKDRLSQDSQEYINVSNYDKLTPEEKAKYKNIGEFISAQNELPQEVSDLSRKLDIIDLASKEGILDRDEAMNKYAEIGMEAYNRMLAYKSVLDRVRHVTGIEFEGSEDMLLSDIPEPVGGAIYEVTGYFAVSVKCPRSSTPIEMTEPMHPVVGNKNEIRLMLQKKLESMQSRKFPNTCTPPEWQRVKFVRTGIRKLAQRKLTPEEDTSEEAQALKDKLALEKYDTDNDIVSEGDLV